MHSRVPRARCHLPAMLAQETCPAELFTGRKLGLTSVRPKDGSSTMRRVKRQDMPCVLYPKGSSWSDAKTVMYANIAGTEFEGVNVFVAMAIKEMEKMHGHRRRKSRPAKPRTVTIILLTNIPPRKRTRSGNASATSNFRAGSLTLFSPRAIRRATKKIPINSRKF